MRFISSCCTLIYKIYVNLSSFDCPSSQNSAYLTNIHHKTFYHTNFESIPFVIFSKSIFLCRYWIYYLLKIFDCPDASNKKRCPHRADIELRGYIVVPLIVLSIATTKIDSTINGTTIYPRNSMSALCGHLFLFDASGQSKIFKR